MNINQAEFMRTAAELHRTISDLEEAALRLARNTIPDQRRSHIHRINKHRDLVAEAYNKLLTLVQEKQDGESSGPETQTAAQTTSEGSDPSSVTHVLSDSGDGEGEGGASGEGADNTGSSDAPPPPAPDTQGVTGDSGTVPAGGSSVQLDDGAKKVDAGTGEPDAGTVPAVDTSNNNGTGSDSGNSGANQGSSSQDAGTGAGTQTSAQASNVPVADAGATGTSGAPVVNPTTVPSATNVGNISKSKLLNRGK